MASEKDKEVLRSLAKKYMDFCNKPVIEQRRDLWRRHNSLKMTRPLIYFRGGPWHKEIPEIMKREVEDDSLYLYEKWLRLNNYYEIIDDDSIFEPWLPVTPVYKHKGWGLDFESSKRKSSEGGSWVHEPPLKDLDDLSGLVKPRHEIDWEATEEKLDIAKDVFGDTIFLELDTKPYYFMWQADISCVLGYLRGIEQIMYDMMDNPEGLHKLLAFMRDGILDAHKTAEENGDWKLSAHQNQAMPYAEELQDPKAGGGPVKRKDLWCFCAAQEYTLISPDMHDEFLLQYQKPIIEHFGLSAYGCCEDLSNKIDMLRQIKNLRRIAVSPMADLKKSAEQIGTDYVISWRPSPADMLSFDFKSEKIKKMLKEGFDICKGQHFDITMKDLETVQNKTERLKDWVKVTREAIDEYWQP